ncbi:MAG TPA: hypothetical protein VN174_03155 [Candidatus Methanoperedens sp.]|nr:hypothetical protein [Candidatus Methanoperedens sp.]
MSIDVISPGVDAVNKLINEVPKKLVPGEYHRVPKDGVYYFGRLRGLNDDEIQRYREAKYNNWDGRLREEGEAGDENLARKFAHDALERADQVGMGVPKVLMNGKILGERRIYLLDCMAAGEEIDENIFKYGEVVGKGGKVKIHAFRQGEKGLRVGQFRAEAMAGLFEDVAAGVADDFPPGDKIKGLDVIFLPYKIRAFHWGGVIVMPEESAADIGAHDGMFMGVAVHEMVHAVAYERYGNCAVPGLVEGAAVAFARRYVEGIYGRDVRNGEYPLLQRGLRDIFEERPEGDFSKVMSPTKLYDFAEKHGFDKPARSYEFSYPYGAAFFEVFVGYQMDERHLSFDEAKVEFWKLYEGCCGEVRNPGTGKLLARHGVREDGVGSDEILMAGLLNLDYFKGKGGEAGKLLDAVPRELAKMMKGEHTLRNRDGQ